MLTPLKEGRIIIADPKKSKLSALEGYAKKQYESELGCVYVMEKYAIANLDIRKVPKGDTIHNILIIHDVFSSLEKAQEAFLPSSQKQKKAGKKKKEAPHFEVVPLEDEEEVRVLWCSRHNMQLEGYLSLCDDVFPGKIVRVFPCQPRIVDVQQIIRIADRFGCKAIAAILSDDLYRDLVHSTTISRTVLKPHINMLETPSRYCPRGSKKAIVQRQYEFLNWEDLRTGYIYPRTLRVEDV